MAGTLHQLVSMLFSAPLAGSRIQEGSKEFGEVVPKDDCSLQCFWRVGGVLPHFSDSLMAEDEKDSGTDGPHAALTKSQYLFLPS